MVGLLVGGLVSYPYGRWQPCRTSITRPFKSPAQLPGADPQTHGVFGGDAHSNCSSARSRARPDERRRAHSATTQITLQFDLNRQIDGTVSDTLSAIKCCDPVLPWACRIHRPIRKVNPADTPTLVLGLTSDTPAADATVDAYAKTFCCKRYRKISGVGLVGSAVSQKARPSACSSTRRLWRARGINLEDVRTALGQANVDLPKGTLNSPASDLHTQPPTINC